MNKIIPTLFFLFSSLLSLAQENKSDTLSLDLDHDLREDQVIFDKENAIIICKLSTQKFKTIKSLVLEFDPSSSGIRKTKSGFEFYNNWMRAGYACQFRYSTGAKHIQLIGMSRYEFGPANNDGSGESSVNLLTQNYIGNWNYFDNNKVKLIPIPTIKRKMMLPVVYLEKFNDAVFLKFQDLCSRIFENEKIKMLGRK